MSKFQDVTLVCSKYTQPNAYSRILCSNTCISSKITAIFFSFL